MNKEPELICESRYGHSQFETVTAVVDRPEAGKETINSLKMMCPKGTKHTIVIHPKLKGLKKYASKRGFQVYSGFLSPVIKAKDWMVRNSKADHVYINDCDWNLVTPIDPLYNTLINNEDMIAISPLSIRHNNKIFGKFIDVEKYKFIFLDIKERSVENLKPRKENYFYTDFLNLSSVLINRSLYDEIPFDTEYGMGHAHEDWFCSIKMNSDYKCAVHKGVISNSIEGKHHGSYKYTTHRFNEELVYKSIIRFTTKWQRIIENEEYLG